MRSERSRVAWCKSRRAGHEKNAYYQSKNDLQGRKVETPSKGIYIIDGKKMFIK